MRAMVLLFVIGCASTPRPAALQAVDDSLANQARVASLEKLAPEAVKQAKHYHQLANKAFDDGEDQQVRSSAETAQHAYHTIPFPERPCAGRESARQPDPMCDRSAEVEGGELRHRRKRRGVGMSRGLLPGLAEAGVLGPPSVESRQRNAGQGRSLSRAPALR